MFSECIDWKSIKLICEKNNLDFHNPSFGGLLIELKDKFLEVPRVSFTKEIRNIVAEKIIIFVLVVNQH